MRAGPSREEKLQRLAQQLRDHPPPAPPDPDLVKRVPTRVIGSAAKVMSSKKYYVVTPYMKGIGPDSTFSSLDDAKAECKRRAQDTPGQKFVVLEPTWGAFINEAVLEKF